MPGRMRASGFCEEGPGARAAAWVLAIVLAGCGAPETPAAGLDAGARPASAADAGTAVDAGEASFDAGAVDAAIPELDAGDEAAAPDAGVDAIPEADAGDVVAELPDAGEAVEAVPDAGEEAAAVDAGAPESPDAGPIAVVPSFHLILDVEGLAGHGLTLQSGAEVLAIDADGSQAFAKAFAPGDAFAVTVALQPHQPKQTCTVSPAQGTVESADVPLAVRCVTDTFAIGGTIEGLAGTGLALGLGEEIVVAGAGDVSFRFHTLQPSGSAFEVSVLSQPQAPAQTCVVAGGAGNVDESDVLSIAVSCTTNRYHLGGSVSGLQGSGFALALGTELLPIAPGQGTFSFASLVASGDAYAVTVAGQPASPWQTCVLDHATGIVLASDVSDLAASCSTNTYALGGSISGLDADGLVLHDGSDDLAIASGATGFSFPSPRASGSGYAVIVKAQPAGRTCAVSNGSGTIANGPVSSVSVSCTKNSYSVGGSISGLAAGGLVLHNGGDDLALAAGATSFSFPTPIASGGGYAVSVKSQPSGLSCAVANGSGTVTTSAVSSVSVSCAPSATFLVGGTIAGLSASGLVLHNGSDDLAIAAGATSFSFPTPLAAGSSYAVSVKAQPSGLTCSVARGSGTIGSASVSDVAVTCAAAAYTIGGTVSGLNAAGLVLRQGSEDLSVPANATSFTFPTPVASGGTFSVSVVASPPSEECVASNATGPVKVAVTSVWIECVAAGRPIGAWSRLGAVTIPGGAPAVAASVEVTHDGHTLYVGFPQLSSTFAPDQAWSLDLLNPAASFVQLGLTNMPKAFGHVDVDLTGMPIIVGRVPGSQPSMAVPPARWDGSTWTGATLPAGALNWGGTAPGRITPGPNPNELWVLGGSLLLHSFDNGLHWSQLADMGNFSWLPQPSSKLGYIGQPGYTNDAPYFIYWGWNYSLERAPWGEYFAGGETAGMFHSLDDGATWEPTETEVLVPQRDSTTYQPMYPNPACFACRQGANHLGTGFTPQGEVLLSRNTSTTGMGMFKYSRTGQYVPADGGLPAQAGTALYFAGSDAGLTFMTGRYPAPSSPPPPAGLTQRIDVFAYDGVSWSRSSPLVYGPGSWQPQFGSLAGDGHRIFAGSGTQVWQWTPTRQAVPTVELGPARTITLPAAIALSPSVSPAALWSYQWSARGPAPVTFDAPTSLDTSASFAAPGNYVLNLEASNGTVTGGASVIVHVKPQAGGTPPTLSPAGQPKNQLLVVGQPATFQVSVDATSTGPLHYQWKRDGTDLVGANGASYTLPSAKASDDGSTFYCLVTSPFGHVLSNAGTLGNPPTIAVQPADEADVAGPVTFAVAATGTWPMTWQWFKDGQKITTGGDGSSFTTSTAGTYSVVVTNIFGQATSRAAVFTPGSAPTYAVTLNAASTAAGAGHFAPGTQVALQTTFNYGGDRTQRFASFSSSAGLSFASDPVMPWVASFTMPARDVSIVANYVRLPTAYTLDVVNGSGSGNPLNAHPVPGQTLSIAANPAPAGKTFDRWVGATVADPAAPNTTLVMPAADVLVSATYR